MSLVKRVGIVNALAALLGGEGIDQKMSRADEPLVHGRSGLDGDQFIHQGLVNAATKAGQGWGQDKMSLAAVRLYLRDATGIHDGEIGA